MSLRMKWGFVVGLSAGLFGCASSPYPHPIQADVAVAQKQRTGVTLADLEQGRSLYLSRCGSCHQVVDPKSVAPSEWPHEVAEMQERAKLDAGQVDAIVLYLVTIASRG
jgi:mono/diheme cytochrome c family protein